MKNNQIKSHPRFVSFFLNIAEWLGLQRNAGMALAALYLSKGTSNEKMSAEVVAKTTGYSRSNVSLVLSHLEAMNLVVSENDKSQTGRGRKKILYSVGTGSTSPINFVIKKMMGQLKEFSIALDAVLEETQDEPVDRAVRELKAEAESAFSELIEQ